MRRYVLLFVSAVWFLIAPGLVAGLIPRLITSWTKNSDYINFTGREAVGTGITFLCGAGVIAAFLQFAFEGKGTPAPIIQTRNLVITGFYRWVRNPMYVFVLGLIAGQFLIFGHLSLLLYGLAVWLALHVYVVTIEEPRLLRDFRNEFIIYRMNVHRWLPGVRPWNHKT